MAQGSELAANRDFSQAQAFSLAAALLTALLLPNVTTDWLVGSKISAMRSLCEKVKKGNYTDLISVPNESSEGDEGDAVLSLMRDMNWMARRIQSREQDLMKAVEDLRCSREQIREQNVYLVNFNEELLAAQSELQERSAELEKAYAQMENMAMTDPLTSIANRRCFFEHLERHFVENLCCCRPISLMILDIDWFKRINDTYGHQSGDLILKELALIIRKQSRATDLPARLGGEEYALLLPDAGSQEAITVARRIQTTLAGYTFSVEKEKTVTVTVSIGICTLTSHPCWDRDKLYSYADQALYYSKNNGRNSISIYNPELEAFIGIGLN
ncbi:hypothetical protein P22_0702 [Propionispora sp. 2/2-37]|uniref:GGDEF domain-containing protein n=1 Tax=Propionispora sp. 2/2-37 TaxID=1677858 RepID=UPI0006BB73AD|nr:GGDEF domain-containing protein [Propionispora sp. 2/2-37]CUH94636.1 hypothetical protein P22_0702 [Propionispora sp. 2/2-37]